MNEEDYSSLFIPSFHTRYVYPPPHFVPTQPPSVPSATPYGQLVPGNINLSNRPIIRNANGTVSTEKSFSIGTDKGEVLIPQIVGGKTLSKNEAIDHYKQTGEHLGIFKDVRSANAQAEIIHNRNQSTPTPTPIIPTTGAAKYYYVDPRATQTPILPQTESAPRGIGILPPNAINILLRNTLRNAPRLADDKKDLLKDTEDTFYGGGNVPAPTPTPTPVARTGASYATV